MLFLDSERIHRLSAYPALVAALLEMNRAGFDLAERILLSEPKPAKAGNDWLLLPAWRFGRDFGVKLVSVFPDNPQADKPSIQGLYVLFDGTDGRAVATLDGAALTFVKTAANSALAADLLARKDAATLLMIGTGALAPHLAAAHAAVRPIRRIFWWGRRKQAAEAASAAFRAAHDAIEVKPVTDLKAAMAEADIVCAATSAREPIVKGAWLKPGCHLDLVGGYLPEMREADDAALQRATRCYVDWRQTTISVAGDVCAPIRAGLIASADFIDLFQLARGEKAGRLSSDEITWFKSGGGGHEDLAVASHLVARAKAATT
jgi:alanine dehydrogenase